MDRPSSGDPSVTQSQVVAASQAELDRARAKFQASLGALEHRLEELRDWRLWLRRWPVSFLTAAFTAGFLWGLRGR
jgi:hypothetical protein